MKMIYILGSLITLLFTGVGCRNTDYIDEDNFEEEVEEYDNDEEEYDESLVDTELYPDWTTLTHSKDADPNFEVVFAQNTLLRIDLTISSSSWSTMWADLKTNLGSSSGGNMGGNFGGGNNMQTDLDFTPVWVPCTFTFNDTDWYEVGVRFKGNSSLSTCYSSGINKLSMKLDFDEYEDQYPALTNQRFYGFKQLNLNSNYNDESFMREKVGADLFRAFGIPAANTSFCELWVDYGSGSQYFGVYTIVEEVDNTVIKTQFSDNSGNLYKPEADAGSFKSGTYDTSEFNLKTNTDVADYADVKALYDIINDSSRTSNPDAWQAELESIFNVDHFLKWLAANIVIQNWDTYGNMAHNYFLYNNPEDGLLTWIPWDNNEAFQTGNTALSASALNYVSTSWPLIRYIISVDEYEEIYKAYLRQFIDEVFIPTDLSTTYESYYTLLKQAAYDERSSYTFLESDYDFDSAVSTLKSHATSRYNSINSYVN